MAQPPDDRRPLPGEPDEPTPPTEAPTVAWTPPDDGGPESSTVPEPPEPPATPEPSVPASPLISWSPSGGTAPPTEGTGTPVPGWAPPGSATPDGSPVTAGWAAPDDSRQAAPIAGYVIAGTPSRVVAFLVDSVLLVIVTIIVALIADPTLFDIRTPAPSTPNFLAVLIVIAIDFAYFVWCWTSRARATLGMRLVRIHVIEATGDRPLRLVPAAARWLLLTGAFSLLILLPVAQGILSLGALIWYTVLLVAVVANPLRQGIHDLASGSLVVQRVGVPSNAAVVGCLLLVFVLVMVFIVLPILVVMAMGSDFEQYLNEVQRST